MAITTKTYITKVNFYEHTIFTTVTKDPNSVTAWITQTDNLDNRLGHHQVVGLDVEWRQDQDENIVDVLQLCVGHRCLIFQIMHAPYIPSSLIDFLNNPSYTFTGVGINSDVEKLVKLYGIGRNAKVVDVEWLATQVRGKQIVGLKALAEVVLGRVAEKLKNETTCPWDDQWLSKEQVDYASTEGFLCFEIARVLISSREMV